jgi:hypothetical protein
MAPWAGLAYALALQAEELAEALTVAVIQDQGDAQDQEEAQDRVVVPDREEAPDQEVQDQGEAAARPVLALLAALAR